MSEIETLRQRVAELEISYEGLWLERDRLAIRREAAEAERDALKEALEAPATIEHACEHVAVCSCGWRSSAHCGEGLAWEEWDKHRDRAESHLAVSKEEAHKDGE